MPQPFQYDMPALDRWGELLNQHKPLKYDQKLGTLRSMTGWERLVCAIRPSQRKACDQKIAQVMSQELHNIFENKTATAKGPERSLADFAERLFATHSLQTHAPKEAAIVERWLVGIQHQQGKDTHYTLKGNLQFFAPDEKCDLRLVGVPQAFAESNPDFVEFALKSDLYGQMKRACTSTTLELNKSNEPIIPLVHFDPTANHNNIRDELITTTRHSWQDAKKIIFEQAKDADMATPSDLCNMTQWGIDTRHNYEWESLRPIAKIEIGPNHQPGLQVISYLPGKGILPNVFGDQGHTGMAFVDRQGFVYSMGFFCHPESNFYAALKAQRSVLRSPDRYESRVDTSWQQLVDEKLTAKKQRKAKRGKPVDPAEKKGSQLVRWNEGILQFSFKDDAGQPCIQKILQSSKGQYGEIKGLRLLLKRQLKEDATEAAIRGTAQKLLTTLQKEGIEVTAMTADEKFQALMGRAHKLQQKTLEANRTGDWSKGALPYMMMEENCAHIARYYFGRWAEVHLDATKDPDVINTRPLAGVHHHPRIDKSPLSRWRWAAVATKIAACNLLARVLALVPGFASKRLGRGQGERLAEGSRIAPRTSFTSCAKKLFNSMVSPQQAREEAMRTQFVIPSWTRKAFKWLQRPTGLVPMYR